MVVEVCSGRVVEVCSGASVWLCWWVVCGWVVEVCGAGCGGGRCVVLVMCDCKW